VFDSSARRSKVSNADAALSEARYLPSRMDGLPQSTKGANMDAHELVTVATQLLADSPSVAPSSGISSGRTTTAGGSPWITVHEAARRARCGVKLIYREFRAGRLKGVRVGGRRELRLRSEWIDAWLLGREPNDRAQAARVGLASESTATRSTVRSLLPTV
jgi:excisionase family DNA binding protein